MHIGMEEIGVSRDMDVGVLACLVTLDADEGVMIFVMDRDRCLKTRGIGRWLCVH